MGGHNAVGTPSGARRGSAEGKIALGLQSQTSVRQAARAITFLPIAAILVAVFVLEADFHSTPRPILIVRTPAVAISVRAVIVGARSPIPTCRTVVRVHIAFHLIPHSAHVVLAHLPHIVAVSYTHLRAHETRHDL